MKFHMYSLVFFAAVLGLVSVMPSQAKVDISSNVLETAGEVFFKGSIDGKSMFMVLGMKDAKDAIKEIKDWAIDEKDLADIGNDFNDEHHIGDFKDTVGEGVDRSKEAAEHLLSAPWKSLKKIPKAY
ncbi:hypothetical protein WDW86_17620 [Bdellovibrionota bacterium FG-2]